MLDDFTDFGIHAPHVVVNLSDVERFYQLYGGQGNWGWLDDEERAWIRAFNERIKKVKEARKKKAAQ